MPYEQDHINAIESYVNGNITSFKIYLGVLSKIELLRLTKMFVEDFGYSFKKIIRLLDAYEYDLSQGKSYAKKGYKKEVK